MSLQIRKLVHDIKENANMLELFFKMIPKLIKDGRISEIEQFILKRGDTSERLIRDIETLLQLSNCERTPIRD